MQYVDVLLNLSIVNRGTDRKVYYMKSAIYGPTLMLERDLPTPGHDVLSKLVILGCR